MTRERLYLFDTTLRDGQQTPGIDFSVEDKIAIAAHARRVRRRLCRGRLSRRQPDRHGLLRAEAHGKREVRRLRHDQARRRLGLQRSRPCGAAAGEVRRHLLRRQELGLPCRASRSAAPTRRTSTPSAPPSRRRVAAGKEALVDCEHFFDGYKANPDYALACASTAFEAGARWVVLCDTNGGTQPSEVRDIVAAVIAAGIPGDHLGIHAHDDTGQAVANSLAAVEAGVRQIQGTLNGIGERCGNANLVTLIPTLVLKPAFADRFETGITPKQLAGISRLSRAFDELLNRAPEAQAPYVGASAFATKAGIHASALAKEPQTYEHVPPEAVGNRRKVMVSDQGGKSNFLAELKRRGIDVAKDDDRLDALICDRQGARGARAMPTRAPTRASSSWRAACCGTVPDFFDVDSFRCMVERRFDAIGNAEDGVRGGGQDRGRRRGEDVGRRRQRPGQRARPRAAQGSRQVPGTRSPISNWSTSRCASSTAAPRPITRVLIESRDGDRRALVDGRRLGQHHRRLVPGADGFDRLQADEEPRHGRAASPPNSGAAMRGACSISRNRMDHQ